MSFHRTGAGSRDAITDQQAGQFRDHGGTLADLASDIGIKTLALWGDDEHAYSFNATGHGANGHATLKIEIETHGFLPAPKLPSGEDTPAVFSAAAAKDVAGFHFEQGRMAGLALAFAGLEEDDIPEEHREAVRTARSASDEEKKAAKPEYGEDGMKRDQAGIPLTEDSYII